MKPADRILARRYARAYVLRGGEDPARAQSRLDALAALSSALSPLREEFDNPAVPQESKSAALEAARPAVGDEAVSFALVLLEAKRFGLLQEIAVQAAEALDAARNRIRVEVESARALDKAQAAELERAMSARTGMEVLASYTVRPELLGGLRIKAGDLLVENSVRGRLKRLKDTLREAGPKP
ncbi:MAG: ATP synthase F1 subunit delta [Elusimicrobia bacterium]|nr:ATP synthase F1 subunit delta [Elusimicrobiota bacterium]